MRVGQPLNLPLRVRPLFSVQLQKKTSTCTKNVSIKKKPPDRSFNKNWKTSFGNIFHSFWFSYLETILFVNLHWLFFEIFELKVDVSCVFLIEIARNLNLKLGLYDETKFIYETWERYFVTIVLFLKMIILFFKVLNITKQDFKRKSDKIKDVD